MKKAFPCSRNVDAAETIYGGNGTVVAKCGQPGPAGPGRAAGGAAGSKRLCDASLCPELLPQLHAGTFVVFEKVSDREFDMVDKLVGLPQMVGKPARSSPPGHNFEDINISIELSLSYGRSQANGFQKAVP